MARAVIKRDYQIGQEFITALVNETRSRLVQVKQEFYHCDEDDNSSYEAYLQQCNSRLLSANNVIRRRGLPLEVIDSDVKIVAMLNQLRQVEADTDLIAFITDFWKELKTGTDNVRSVCDYYQNNVLNRLKQNCVSYSSTDIHLDISRKYTDDVSTYITDIEKLVSNMRMLLDSFGGGLHQELYFNSSFSERVLIHFDHKAFPILRLIPDASDKMNMLCDAAIKWVERDERYVREVDAFIHRTRSITKQREQVLRDQREKQKKTMKSVKSSSIILNSNREKLQKVEAELVELERKMISYRHEKKCKFEEIRQKESMVDFLKITLTQTKRNYNLQMQRSRLMKQMKQMEAFFSEIEHNLATIQTVIAQKGQEKMVIEEKVETHEKAYTGLKSDLDKFTLNLEQLEHDVNNLSDQLFQLEIIQSYKTSPEQIEEIFGRPSTVKLAPSLKEKIQQRKRRYLKSKPK